MSLDDKRSDAEAKKAAAAKGKKSKASKAVEEREATAEDKKAEATAADKAEKAATEEGKTQSTGEIVFLIHVIYSAIDQQAIEKIVSSQHTLV